jgi:hypothetical protein
VAGVRVFDDGAFPSRVASLFSFLSRCQLSSVQE